MTKLLSDAKYIHVVASRDISIDYTVEQLRKKSLQYQTRQAIRKQLTACNQRNVGRAACFLPLPKPLLKYIVERDIENISA